MEIKNFNNIKENFSFYGGNAGNKKSFIKENGENWFLKFPKTTKYFQNVDISYTTSPLSEYIGSHIYKELGFPVHNTELGIKDNKVVVACQNFIPKNNDLFELEKIFNDDLGEFEEERENLRGNSEIKYYREIEEIDFVLNKNKIINQFPEIKERFWDMFLVDAFINNNDRHLGNWGLLVNNEKNLIKLAPIYDNGNSFFTKHSEENMIDKMENLNQLILNGKTPYLFRGKNIDSIQVIKNISLKKDEKVFENEIKNSILRNVPKINLERIYKIIDEIPETYEGIKIIGSGVKKFYKEFLKERYEKILLPALEKVKKLEKEKKPWEQKMKADKDKGLGLGR